MKDKKLKKKKLRIESKSVSIGDMVEEILAKVNEDRPEEKELRKADVKLVLTMYHDLIVDEVRHNGVIVLPGIVKIFRKFKPARERRKGINPFTKKEQWFDAKPASYACKARPLAKTKLAASGKKQK